MIDPTHATTTAAANLSIRRRNSNELSRRVAKDAEPSGNRTVCLWNNNYTHSPQCAAVTIQLLESNDAPQTTSLVERETEILCQKRIGGS